METYNNEEYMETNKKSPQQQLQEAKVAVQRLFTDASYSELRIEASDYDIDQIANVVACVSDELYLNEKMMLLHAVKRGKNMSQSRNLLQNGDLKEIYSNWKMSPNVTIERENPYFKGSYLDMPNTISIDETTDETYAYQKLDESKLKPYTRYFVRGFIGNSKDLRILITRYGEEIDVVRNVLNDLTEDYMVSSYVECTRCKPQIHSTQRNSINNALYNDHHNEFSYYNSDILNDLLLDNEESKVYYDSGEINVDNYYMPCPDNEKEVCCNEHKKDHHQFSFFIDTGEIHLGTNLGISIIFKLGSRSGYATLSNIEVVEKGPLLENEFEMIKKREQRWEMKRQAMQSETLPIYRAANEIIHSIFKSTDYKKIPFEKSLIHLVSAASLLKKMPYIYNKWLTKLPDMNYKIFKNLQQLLVKAYQLYRERNLLENGDFNAELIQWNIIGNPYVERTDVTSILVIPNWNSQVTQYICLPKNQGYVLRVTGRKEGMGEGYVTVSDSAGNMEKLTFISCDNYSNNSVVDIEKYYATQFMHFFPDTDQVRIDIGATEGIFKIISVELLLIESEE